jgi:hypothetical protein
MPASRQLPIAWRNLRTSTPSCLVSDRRLSLAGGGRRRAPQRRTARDRLFAVPERRPHDVGEPRAQSASLVAPASNRAPTARTVQPAGLPPLRTVVRCSAARSPPATDAPFGARGSTGKLVISCACSGASAPRHFWGGGTAAWSLPPIDDGRAGDKSRSLHGWRFSSCDPGMEHVEAQALGPTCMADPLSQPSALDRESSWAHVGKCIQPLIRPKRSGP